ncbi:hypothetical protein SAMN05443248_0559 [Bradyrhizobium erythrophlei]|jgi:hypothetical protein|uniref:Uncharacterized protein n=1 Tax=Bradyrhizobium erythrophlei TaxID=1437360 RepID=A0A1M5HNT3_9BRAD|nr:hypothetical protein SAMN05443248_0559 [Bradyrhizobium erythrophlei]
MCLRRASPNRRPFGAIDWLILGGVCGSFPKSYDALAIVCTENLSSGVMVVKSAKDGA